MALATPGLLSDFSPASSSDMSSFYASNSTFSVVLFDRNLVRLNWHLLSNDDTWSVPITLMMTCLSFWYDGIVNSWDIPITTGFLTTTTMQKNVLTFQHDCSPLNKIPKYFSNVILTSLYFEYQLYANKTFTTWHRLCMLILD